MRTRIRCHVIETPTNNDWPRRGGALPRELLPWADPYIATLMRRLEAGFDDSCPPDASDPFAREQSPATEDWLDDGWEEDAFMPRPLVTPRIHSYPPVIGGFPLLDADDDLAREEEF